MDMSMIQMRGLIVLVSVNLDTKKIKMRIKEKTMNKKLDLHIQLPKGSIIHQERKLMRLQRKLEMELSPYCITIPPISLLTFILEMVIINH